MCLYKQFSIFAVNSTNVELISIFFVTISSTNIDIMQNLGNLEETILLIIMAMQDDSYGFSVSEAYAEHTGKSISISAVHTVMSRLEDKGLIYSEMGGETTERGGRRKRIFRATPEGVAVIEQLKASRQKLWGLIPGLG